MKSTFIQCVCNEKKLTTNNTLQNIFLILRYNSASYTCMSKTLNHLFFNKNIYNKS